MKIYIYIYKSIIQNNLRFPAQIDSQMSAKEKNTVCSWHDRQPTMQFM